jgi:hypothetical protein
MFNVHSLVRTKTKSEAERVGKYMIRSILALERLTFLEAEGKVGYRHGENGAEMERNFLLFYPLTHGSYFFGRNASSTCLLMSL